MLKNGGVSFVSSRSMAILFCTVLRTYFQTCRVKRDKERTRLSKENGAIASPPHFRRSGKEKIHVREVVRREPLHPLFRRFLSFSPHAERQQKPYTASLLVHSFVGKKQTKRSYLTSIFAFPSRLNLLLCMGIEAETIEDYGSQLFRSISSRN